jgi:branched-chain amino acid transport system ATP-binding protein
LQADSVSMSFGGVQALSGVSVTLHQGETLGLIGPNGAGKTTLFNCITGVVPGYRGNIQYDGRDLRYLKPHQRARLKIARTFQNLELFDELSALDNLVLPLDALSRRGVIGDLLRLPTTVFDECKAQEKARAILHFLDLGNYADAPAGDLPAARDRTRALSRAPTVAPGRAGSWTRRTGDG